MELKKQDVEYMLENGVGSYFKLMKDTLLGSFGNMDAAGIFHKIFIFVKTTVLAIAKFLVTYYIFLRIYERIGFEKVIILLIAAYITHGVAKEELRSG